MRLPIAGQGGRNVPSFWFLVRLPRPGRADGNRPTGAPTANGRFISDLKIGSLLEVIIAQ